MTAFQTDAVEDAVKRFSATGLTYASPKNWAETIIDAAACTGTKDVVTAWPSVGPTATNLCAARPQLENAGIRLHQTLRAYDGHTWPHATKGFFKLKHKIPTILRALGLSTV